MGLIRRLFVFILTLNSIVASRGVENLDSTYRAFKACLQKGGVHSKSILSRGDSPSYQDLNYQWQARGPPHFPLAYIRVRNEAEVVATVRCGRSSNMHLVPKGGGHSLERFGFGDSNSVIVDVRSLTTVVYNKAKMTATVGAGWQIGPLAWKLWELGKIFTPLGECPTIGISGIATGGGWGYFVRKLGLILDNVLEINIVTANGQLIKASGEKLPDLFWALSGGVGSSFGIVTKFVFRVYPAPPAMLFGSLTYDVGQFPQVFDAWQQEAPVAPKDISPFMTISARQIEVTFFDPTGTTTNFETIAKKFPPNPIVDVINFTFPGFMLYQAKVISSEILKPEAQLNSPSDLRKLNRKSPAQIWQKRKSFYVGRRIGGNNIRKFQNLIAEMPTTTDAVVFFEAYGGHLDEIGRNETGFVHRSGILYNAAANFRTQKLDDTITQAEASQFIEKFYAVGKSIFQHKESYQNYVDLELPNHLERYYGENLPRLIQIKKKYDPENFFYNPQSVPNHI